MELMSSEAKYLSSLEINFPSTPRIPDWSSALASKVKTSFDWVRYFLKLIRILLEFRSKVASPKRTVPLSSPRLIMALIGVRES